jgi:hypothetical protein
MVREKSGGWATTYRGVLNRATLAAPLVKPALSLPARTDEFPIDHC